MYRTKLQLRRDEIGEDAEAQAVRVMLDDHREHWLKNEAVYEQLRFHHLPVLIPYPWHLLD
jgi:hypothetical protein